MRQASTTFDVQTPGQGLVEFTADVQAWLRQSAIETGLLTLFCRHTSASLTIQENADPDVMRDLIDFFAEIAPEVANGSGQGSARAYRHSSEGPDDMPAHIKAALTDVSLSIPVQDGQAVLGTWQGIYLFEHRRRGHHRRVAAHLLGE